MRNIFQITWKYSKWISSFYYVGLKDLYLRILTWLKKENPIGRYVEIVNKIEREMYCSGTSAGGMCYRVLIKIFLFKEFFDSDDVIEEVTCVILEHELLHMTLRNRINSQTSKKLDNIHMPLFVNGRWTIDWKYSSPQTTVKD